MVKSIPIRLGPILPLLFAGCAALTHDRDWGEDVTLTPSRSRIGKASLKAISDPRTWLPAAAGAIFLVTGSDRPVSDWAVENAPLFRSRENALRASDNLRETAKIGWIVTMLLADSGDGLGEIVPAKLKGAGAEWLSDVATRNLTWGIKHASSRERPNGADRESFPSGHSSDAFVHASMAIRNTDWIPVHDNLRLVINYGLLSVAAGTAWARIEGGVHYPSEVLFGAALGNFMAVLFTEAFLGLDGGVERPAEIRIEPSVRGALLSARVRF